MQRTKDLRHKVVTDIPRTSNEGAGFTIVELIIVIVVIAILATVAVIGYAGVQDNAAKVALQSDLNNAAAALEHERQHSNGYPTSVDEVDGGLPTSKGNTLAYQGNATYYCVTGRSERPAVPVFHITSSRTDIQDGPCPELEDDIAVTTVAGGAEGFGNGSGLSAQFSTPYGLAIGSDGTLYVADSGNNRIRAISSSGVVSTYAGSGVAGRVDGTGAAAQFDTPSGLALDGIGNLYVTDTENDVIRRVASGAVVSTIIGSGTAGFNNGTGTSGVRLNYPLGIAVDGSSSLYFADMSNHNIRRVNSSGVVSTYAGNSPGIPGFNNGTDNAVYFNYPVGVAVDASGSLYVADRDNNQIRKVTTSGVTSTFAGSTTAGFADGSAANARFNHPIGVAVGPDGSIYVADTDNHRIRKISPTGEVSTIAGGAQGFADGDDGDARFNSPIGLVVAGDGTIYVSDAGNHRIRKIIQ